MIKNWWRRFYTAIYKTIDKKLKPYPWLRPWAWFIILWLLGFAITFIIALPFKLLVVMIS